MNAGELYKTGQLQEAIDAQIKEVKANPADQGKRMFLFELLAFAGDLDRARRQIDAVQYGDAEKDTVVLGYRKLLDAEEARRKLFTAGLKPQFLLDPPEHLRLRLEAVDRLRENRPVDAQQLLDKAAEMTPTVKGELNGKSFTSLHDYDELFGTVLEVMARGVYYWVPLEQVDALVMNPPRYPRDVLWIPTRLQMRDGPGGEAYLPALYPGSHEHVDNQIKLGRTTDWKELEDGPMLGIGLHTFKMDEESLALLEWRELQVTV